MSGPSDTLPSATRDEQFRAVSAEWRRTVDADLDDDRARTAADLQRWTDAFPALVTETAELKAAGRWRSGPRTLLEALGLHRREVPLVAALGWLLRPEGHHGLGNGVLRRLLEALDLAYTVTDPVSVRLEETRHDGLAARADLVVRVGGHCVLIEAKVFAREQPTQCDRLAMGWHREQPVLVFLTRDGSSPVDAPVSAARWRPLTWRTVTEMVLAAAEETDASPGVWDFLATVRHHHP